MLSALLLFAALAYAADPTDANEAAIRRRPRSMSLTLADLAAESDTTQRAELSYYLGRCFEEIGLLQSAHRQLVRALDGPTVQTRALSGLVRTAERIGDDEAIIAHVAAAPPVAYSPAFSGALWFLRGRHLARTGDAAGAESAMRSVGPSSPRYPAALLHLAVLRHEADAPGEARDLLLQLLSLRAPRSQLARLRLRELQPLAQLDLARVYYAAHRYEESIRLYAPRGKGLWAEQAAVESAWALLILGQPDAAAAALDGVSLLAAEQLWLHLDPSRARPDQWRAEADALAAIAEQYATHPADLWRDWFGDIDESVAVPVPDAFFTAALSDTRLAGAALRLRQIDAERRLIASQPEAWRAVFEALLLTRLSEDEQIFAGRAGGLLLEKLTSRGEMLETLSTQAATVMPR